MSEKGNNLSLSRENYKSIFKLLPHTSYIWQKLEDDLILIEYNRAAEKFTEGKIKSLIGIKASELYKERPIVLEDLKRCVRNQTVVSREIVHKSVTTGKERNLIRFYKFIEPDLVLVHSEDITKQRLAEASLKKEEKEKSMILEAVSDHIIYYNTDQDIIWANQAAIDSVNLSYKEVVSKKCYEIWQNRNEPCEFCPVLRALKTGKTQTSEARTPDGRVWFVSGFPVWDDDGNIIGMVEITRDITAQKYVEENLRRERDILGRLTDTSPVGITLVNKDGKIIFANVQAEKILGLTKNEITQLRYNAPSWKITDYDGNPFPDEKLPFQKVKSTRESVFDVRHAIEWPNGKKCYLSINASPIFDENKNLEGMVATIEDITEKWVIEQNLKESEESFRTITEQSLMGICIIQDFEIKYINQQMADIYGYSLEEVYSWQAKDFFKVLVNESREYIIEQIKKKQQSAKDVETRYISKAIRKDGSLIWVENYSKSIIYQGKSADLLTQIDITDKMKAEQRLIESEGKYRDMAELLPDVIFEADLEMNLKYVNPAGFAMFGYSLQEMENGINLKQLLTTDSLKKAIKRVKDISLGISTSPNEYELVKKDGSKFYGRVHSRSVIKDDRIVGFRGTVTDITDIKLAEQKLKESEEKYRILIEKSLQGICILQDVRIIFANEALSEILGYSINELLSFSNEEIINLIHPDDRKLVFNRHMARLEGKSVPARYEFRVLRKDGVVRIVEMYASRINLNNKTAVQEVFIDITERKKIEEKLKKSEEKYREAYNRINLYKDLFTHDINNIFQNILSSNELAMLYSNIPEKLQDYVEVANLIKEQVSRGSKLVSNVQKLSELEDVDKPLYTLEVYSVLNNVINSIKKSFLHKKIEINIYSSENQYLVKANELFFDVFDNILMNAVKHNKNLTIEIQIKISQNLIDDINYVRIEFSDNGVGIPDIMKDVIFQRDVKKEKASGIGLGLLLVKRIVESYKGSVKVEDRVLGDCSKGSNFIVLIPGS